MESEGSLPSSQKYFPGKLPTPRNISQQVMCLERLVTVTETIPSVGPPIVRVPDCLFHTFTAILDIWRQFPSVGT
jgi:hypothetical protein